MRKRRERSGKSAGRSLIGIGLLLGRLILRSGYDTGVGGSRSLFEKLLGDLFELLKFGIFVDERRVVDDGCGSDPAIGN